jgi:hypothetical protein
VAVTAWPNAGQAKYVALKRFSRMSAIAANSNLHRPIWNLLFWKLASDSVRKFCVELQAHLACPIFCE